MESRRPDEDDDCPPPLEDMSDHLQSIKSRQPQKEEEVEEIRLAPKKVDVQKPTPIEETKATDTVVVAKQPVKKQQEAFSGLKGGFLLGPQKKTQKQPVKQAEDLTHIKAKPKDEQLKFEEVQSAMSGQLLKNKDEWLNQDFFTKLASNPKLMRAFQDPRYTAIFSEFGKDPQGTMKKFGGNPEFREIMEEFSKMMGSHFESVADQKQRE